MAPRNDSSRLRRTAQDCFLYAYGASGTSSPQQASYGNADSPTICHSNANAYADMEPEANPGSNTKPGSNSGPIAYSLTDS